MCINRSNIIDEKSYYKNKQVREIQLDTTSRMYWLERCQNKTQFLEIIRTMTEQWN